MFNAWFMHYHKYSRQMWYDPQAVARFARGCAWAEKNNIGLLIISDYHRNYPEYLSFWSRKTLRRFLEAAHQHNLKVLPYTAPVSIDPSSDFYGFHGDKCSIKVRTPHGISAKAWGWISLPDGAPYRLDYRGSYNAYIQADPCTAWKEYYLEQCEGLLDFGFDGIYIDQHQDSTASIEHPDINEQAMNMLKRMRRMVKEANTENVICANVMAAAPIGKKGREFVRRTTIADFGLTESANNDISADLKVWIKKTKLPFFIFSHGCYESHRRKIRIAKALNQPLCLMVPVPLDEADPRILRLYESQSN